MGESLTRDDLTKMKYTWRVALETEDGSSDLQCLQEGFERY